MKPLRSDVDLSPAIRSLAQLLFILSILSIAWGLFGFVQVDLQETGFSLALIALGVMTLYIRIPAMLPVYSVALFWLALQDAIEVSPGSMAFALFELVAGIGLLNRFRIYSHIQEDHVLDYFRLDPTSPRLIPAIAKFPLLSILMGSAAMIEIVAFMIIGGTIARVSINQSFEEIMQAIMSYSYLLYFVEPFSVFAFALGSSARIVRQPPRMLGAIGTILGSLLLAVMIVLLIVGQFILGS